MNRASHALAELRWLITDPPLLRAPPDVDDGGALADDPAALERAADTLAGIPRPHRLGHHFENLVATALAHSRRFEIVARNLPLRREGVTPIPATDAASGGVAARRPRRRGPCPTDSGICLHCRTP